MRGHTPGTAGILPAPFCASERPVSLQVPSWLDFGRQHCHAMRLPRHARSRVLYIWQSVPMWKRAGMAQLCAVAHPRRETKTEEQG